MSISFAAITLPTQLSNLLSYVLMVIMAGVTINVLIKVGLGFKDWSRGDEAWGKIKFAVLTFAVPWIIQAACNAFGIWSRLGISIIPTGLALPAELIDAIQYGMWLVICFFVGLAIFSGMEAFKKMERGDDGKQQLWGAVGMAAAPFIVIAVSKVGGYWDAFGLKLI